MIETFCLTDIPLAIDLPAFLKKLRIDGRPEYAERCLRLVQQASSVARAKAAYGLVGVEAKGEDTVRVGGIDLVSRVLRVNLGESRRMFPFVITCGTELEAWAKPIRDMLERYWADAIMEEALGCALNALTIHVSRRYDLAHTGMMNPGSLDDWPLEQQSALFTMLGETAGQIGVTLNDSFIMAPMKSASGVLFATESTYENCQMCPRDACPNRRAPYDAGLYERRYTSSRD